ncbi:MAG: hypothetical protein Q7U97_11770 [Rhodocyclaceae bacterium]|nr:hypothetical protein [Rhodocyclaceae bacterium]
MANLVAFAVTPAAASPFHPYCSATYPRLQGYYRLQAVIPNAEPWIKAYHPKTAKVNRIEQLVLFGLKIIPLWQGRTNNRELADYTAAPASSLSFA